MLTTEKNQKELIIATASAYCLDYVQWVRESYPAMEGLLLPNRRIFNPLKSPEQAMWLSLEMRMSVRHENNIAMVDVPWAGIEEQSVPYTDEPMLALCLAIVQAAAAVAAKGLSIKNIPA